MNKPKVAAEAYIQFLVASPASVSGMEAARVHDGPLVAHDAIMAFAISGRLFLRLLSTSMYSARMQ
jgi:hypothetical protein